jgi:DNA-binding HxlR family transcriptional regulator
MALMDGQDGQECPVEIALKVIGGKWKSLILYHVSTKTMRFSELKREMPEITQRMLTNQLRELERDGIILRTVYPQVPVRVEYSLTEDGRALFPIFKELYVWGLRRVPAGACQLFSFPEKLSEG